MPRTKHPRSGLSSLVAVTLAALLALPACDAGDEAAPGARHLLLITVDTLRADHLGCYGYARPTSPAIDRLASEGVLFETAWATSSWTLPTLTSLFTSATPSAHGCIGDKTALSERFETLAEHLASEGFDTAAIVNHHYLKRAYGLAQGFADYDEELVLATRQESHLAVTAPTVTDKAQAWIAQRAREAPDEPWFLWVHYFDPHFAYKLHAGIGEPFASSSPWSATYSNLDCYDGEIAFTDRELGRLLDALEREDLADETAVVFVADHGEEFLDHGQQGHRQNLHRETVQVPLIVRIPGIAPARIDTPVSTLDLLPTALDLAGLDDAPDAQGRSLMPLLAGLSVTSDERPFVSELETPTGRVESLVRGRWKLVRHAPDERRELYDLEQDPSEQEDQAEQQPGLVEELSRALDAELALARELGTRVGAAAPVDLGSEDRKRIQDLGYAGDD